MYKGARRKVATASVPHRLYDVFHWFAEKGNKQQGQHQHSRDHGTKQPEVILAMQAVNQFALRSLVDERLDEARVLAVADRRCDQPVLTIVEIGRASCRERV